MMMVAFPNKKTRDLAPNINVIKTLGPRPSWFCLSSNVLEQMYVIDRAYVPPHRPHDMNHVNLLDAHSAAIIQCIIDSDLLSVRVSVCQSLYQVLTDVARTARDVEISSLCTTLLSELQYAVEALMPANYSREINVFFYF